MAIKSIQLGTVASAITDSLAVESAIVNIFFCNLNSTTEFVTVHLVSSGASPIATNTILYNMQIDSGNTFTFSTDKLLLAPGDRVYAKTTTISSVSATVSYVVM